MKWKIKENFVPNDFKYTVCKNITPIIEDMIGKKIKAAWDIHNSYDNYNDAQNTVKYLNKAMKEKDEDNITSETIIISFDNDHNLYIGSSEWLHLYSFKR